MPSFRGALPTFKIEPRLGMFAIYQKIDVNTWRYITSLPTMEKAQQIINSTLASIIGYGRTIESLFPKIRMNPLQERYYR